MNAQTTPLAVGSARAPGHAYLGGAKSPEMMIAVRQKLLDLALKNGRRSVPLLVLAGCLEAWLGWNAGARGMAVAIVIVSCVLGAWRFFLGRRDVVGSAARENDRTEIELAGNSLLAGILWASMSIGIYPSLDPQAAGVHIMMLLGSAAIAAHFMTLVRWSYALLVIPSIGSLSLVSMFDRSVHSYALGFLSVFYMATLLLAGRAYRKTATQAIEHALVADAAVESLKKAKDDAEAGLVAKSQFLATMSHEIRTPMNGVLGSLELLRRSGLNPEQQRLARTASSSGSALMAILNDVLDHSKIEAGKLALTTAPVSLHAQMASVVGLFRSNAEAR
ncbi:MAG TPA: histidine kinase dimerization/phospho-acceptor domain-containing protein, partial [Albitalea sp.]|nr:histidine kinase dimerization/phospho-acceptor domain-containing protein [Albitalea sp.]